MDINKQLQWRYSTKNFDPTRQVTDENLDTLIETLRMSPSAGNTQPWHYIVASNANSKKRISAAAKERFPEMYQRIEDASVAIVACSRTDVDDEYLKSLLLQEEQMGRYKDEEQMYDLDRARRQSIEIHRQRLQDLPSWLEHQMYLAIGTFLSTAATLEIDSLVFESIDWQKIDEEFGLSAKGLKGSLVMLLGYRSSDDYNDPNVRSKFRWPQSQIVTRLD